MLASYLKVIYFVTIYLCFLVSLYYRKGNGKLLFWYFLIVCTIETLPFFFDMDKNWIYCYVTLVYIAFFSYYYSKYLKKYSKYIFLLGFLACVVCLYLIQNSKQGFPVGLGVTLALFYISLSLSWFFNEIKNVDEDFIFKKQVFWVSSALLFWSVFFLFRILPMYWLETNDLQFLIMISNIFFIANILSYLMFIVALTRKN